MLAIIGCFIGLFGVIYMAAIGKTPGAPSDVDPLTPSTFEELEDDATASDLPF